MDEYFASLKSGLSIVGYYHANECFDDYELSSIARKIGDHIARYCPQAGILLVKIYTSLPDYPEPCKSWISLVALSFELLWFEVVDLFWEEGFRRSYHNCASKFFCAGSCSSCSKYIIGILGYSKKGKKKTLRITVFCEPWKDIMKLQHNGCFLNLCNMWQLDNRQLGALSKGGTKKPVVQVSLDLAFPPMQVLLTTLHNEILAIFLTL